MVQIKKKRIYDSWEESDGYRVLVDRLWPRGVSKEAALLDEWAKDYTPSSELRKAYHQNIVEWNEFATLYAEELKNNPTFTEWCSKLSEVLKTENITLLTSAKLEPHSHVDVIADSILARETGIGEG